MPKGTARDADIDVLERIEKRAVRLDRAAIPFGPKLDWPPLI
jgi:hypothetical protein